MSKVELKVVRKLVNRQTKYVVEGPGQGWIFKKQFPRKWKAEVALKVYEAGGRVSDYWKAARKEKRPIPEPTKAIATVEGYLQKIKALSPSGEEIEAFPAPYGARTWSKSLDYFEPQLHNTWGEKRGGRVHIDLGWNGVHLMLTQKTAPLFIAFIEEQRAKRQSV